MIQKITIKDHRYYFYLKLTSLLSWPPIIIIALIFYFQIGSFAANNIVEDFENTRTQILFNEMKQKKVMLSIFELNKKMRRVEKERSNLTRDLASTESQVRKLATDIMQLEEQIRTQKSYLRKRLNVLYKFGGQGWIRTLFSAKNASEMERNLKILGIVAQNDLTLLKKYSHDRNEFEIKKDKFNKKLDRLKGINRSIQGKEFLLVNANHSKMKILDEIKKSKEFAELKLEKLKEQSLSEENESGIMDLLLRASFFEQKGQLPLPVKGILKQKFGLIKNTEYNITLGYKGIFLSALKGEQVRTVFSGVVAFAGEVPGLGQTVVIDHGDHYYSVYGNSEKLLVSSGQEVKQSESIAEVGFEDLQMGIGLYFEIRHFSEPYDPTPWLKGIIR